MSFKDSLGMINSKGHPEGKWVLIPTDLAIPLTGLSEQSGNAIMRPALFFKSANQSVMIGQAVVKEGEQFRLFPSTDF